jgi:poly-beta-1,6-N-acetyl-D-glucosamine synthase
MSSASVIIFHLFLFLTVYIQVFLLITFLENRKKILVRRASTRLSFYPRVTILVPAFNEERSLSESVRSLLRLNYPQEQIKILLIDDGSTDNTWEEMQKFSGNPNIEILRKENGGKYTAMNLGLERLETEFVGSLDADSFVDPEALARIMSYFEQSPKTMAVTPSLVAYHPKTVIQRAQQMEYFMSVYARKMLGFLGGIHVTPGPFTIFRRQVFENLGEYRHAHNTEDMEIAYRMQKHRYPIEHCNDAYIYTGTPSTLSKLFRQRLRWIYGFINNSIDYRSVLFRKRYGNFATFTVPAGIISIFAVSYLLGRLLYHLGDFLRGQVLKFQTVGFELSATLKSFDWFFLNTQSFIFLQLLILSLVVFSILLGRKMVSGKWKFSPRVLYFIVIFGIVSPLWLLRAIFNTFVSKRPAWR